MFNPISCSGGSLQIRCLEETIVDPSHIEDRETAKAFLANPLVTVAKCSRCGSCCQSFHEDTLRRSVILTEDEKVFLVHEGFGGIMMPGPAIGSRDGVCDAFTDGKCSLPIRPLNCEAHTCAKRFKGFEQHMGPVALYWIRHTLFDLMRAIKRTIFAHTIEETLQRN